jgi:hypothetical protein
MILKPRCRRLRLPVDQPQFGLLYDNLLDNLDITDPIMKGIYDLNVLNVRDSVPDIAETFHIIPKALIVVMLDGFHGFSGGWILVRALEVPDEHYT